MSSITKVLIVGSGPSGLILALSLAQQGIPVRVIEKSKTYRIGQRGAAILPRSLETFERLGILSKVLEKAATLYPLNLYKMPEGVDVMAEFYASPILDPTPDQPYRNPKVMGQDNLDKILRAELDKFGVKVEIGTELQTIEQHVDFIKVKILKYDLENSLAEPIVEESAYQWVIGADGAKGTVRKQLGLSFRGETTKQAFIVGDIMAQGLKQDKWHIWGEISHVATSLRATETPGLFNFVITGKELGDVDELSKSEQVIRDLLKKNTGNRDDIKWGEIICAGPYTVNIRMVDQFRKGRAFVTGDAGHIHSPTGGQGMNTGIQDSFNLGWKLALVIKGLAPESLLDTFNEERLPVVAEMLDMTSLILKKTVEGNDLQDAMNRTGDVNQLGVNYRFSSIVVDEESEKLGINRSAGSTYHVEADEPVRAGDRAPDALGLVELNGAAEPARLFNLFKPNRHSVLILADKVDYAPMLAALTSYPSDLVHVIVVFSAGTAQKIPDMTVVEDLEGHAHNAYKGPEGTSGVFIIRPDGVIGARVGDAAGIQRYFSRILKF